MFIDIIIGGTTVAFSDFKTISEVQEKFRITYTEDDFFKVEPAQSLR